jgi:DNA-binding MarR family transcriptional regulator
MPPPGEAAVGIALRRALYTFRQALEPELRPMRLSLPLVGILLSLVQEDGVSGAELARRETVRAQTMNQLVAGLVTRGLVERRQHATHGRILTLHLTDAGRKALADSQALAAEVEERMLSAFSPRERDRLLRDLERCVEALAPQSQSARDSA